jgi:hypothetical protein
MYVVLYNPGAAGNMVSAVIDSTDYSLIDNEICTRPDSLRQRIIATAFKENTSEVNLKPHNVNPNSTDIQRLQDVLDAIDTEKKYTCICSHYFYYFMKETDYKIILIDDTDHEFSKWTLDRAIKHGHVRDSLDERMHNVNEYKRLMYEDRIVKKIYMHDILNGNLITILKEFIDTPLNEDLYKSWLHNITK